MSDMFDYLKWRGDISFSQVPPTPVDTLIFSALSYIRFGNTVSGELYAWETLNSVADKFLADPDAGKKVRVQSDLDLLITAASSRRFGRVGVSFYRDVFIPEEDTQFAAVAFYLEDGTAFLAFRGTDDTLVGWREDFNMTFQESVAAQRLAKEYVEEFASSGRISLRMGGHSKGGNLAVYAAAKCRADVQERIIEVYNHDGPGFTEQMMLDPGYLNIIPKVRTYVPQSSVIGMLLEHEEPFTIIKSRHISLMQHDPYFWEVLGPDFVPEDKLTADSRFLDRTFKNWLAGMSAEERGAFFDAVFDLLMTENASRPRDIMRGQNIRAYVKSLQSDDEKRRVIASELVNLIQSARRAQHSGEE